MQESSQSQQVLLLCKFNFSHGKLVLVKSMIVAVPATQDNFTVFGQKYSLSNTGGSFSRSCTSTRSWPFSNYRHDHALNLSLGLGRGLALVSRVLCLDAFAFASWAFFETCFNANTTALFLGYTISAISLLLFLLHFTTLI